MNIFNRALCRAFQLGMRLALPLLPYRDPRILDSVEQLPEVLRANGVERLLLVTDRQIRSRGLTAPLERLLAREGLAVTVYEDTASNPTVDNVEAARLLYLQADCQGLVAFGGGSAIDCGKAVGARLARPGKSLANMEGILKILRPIPFLAAIPTTAGTGSEATLAAVITDGSTHRKYPINDFPLIPRCAVLDPEITRSLPPAVTATTGMDALTHAVEAYIGGSTTAHTRADALEATRLVFAWVEQAYRNGEDMEARRNMLRAAHLAGRAFTRSYVGYVHAVAHSLGGRYNIPHGLANAVLLPVVLEAYGPAVHRQLHELAVEAGISTAEESHALGAERFLAAVRAMNYRMNIPRTLPEVRREDIPELARNAAREANPLYPVPVLWDAGQLEMFYYKVMEVGELLDPNRDPEYRQRPAGALPQRRNAAHGGAH